MPNPLDLARPLRKISEDGDEYEEDEPLEGLIDRDDPLTILIACEERDEAEGKPKGYYIGLYYERRSVESTIYSYLLNKHRKVKPLP